MQPKPFIWQMIKEAVEVNGNKSTAIGIRDWILEHYSDVDVNSIFNQIIICTVNHPSRVHYRENNRPRRCTALFDLLYRTGPGKVEMYDPRIHGNWEIIQDEKGVLHVHEIRDSIDKKKDDGEFNTQSVDVVQLRNHIVNNLDILESDLQLYVDVFGNDGVLYPTEFGTVDIIAVDKHGTFILVMIMTNQNPDLYCGQLLKYRNWVKRHLAGGKSIRCYLIGSTINEQVRYSLADFDDIELREYEVHIKLKEVPILGEVMKLTEEKDETDKIDTNEMPLVQIVEVS